MSARTEKLEHILNQLENESEVITSALVNTRGQLMAAGARMKDMDERALAAMSAALTSVGSRVGDTLKCGDVGAITITGVDRLVIVNSLTSAVFISVAPAASKIGLLEFEIDKTVNDLKQVLG